MKILIVEDHPKIRENIIKFFTLKSYVAEGAFNGEEALTKLSNSSYDIIILDINLPIMNGKDFLKILREKGNGVPIIALTSNSMLEDKLELFDLGVDDYLTKPFELLELEARVNALFKRKDKLMEQKILVRDLEINFSKHKIFKGKEEINISNKEYLIIEFLVKNAGLPKNKTEILEYAWGEREDNLNFSSVTLEAHISYIRKKFGKDFIKTIKGVGYVIDK
ncbi:response regulator transcription factor [Candidatus Gracilibacteria bacterium]|nr:response regulator transcription factor [Candidatus Gracilibacteria bacterium]NUJ98502.1 response regulator transcription factor [Candidatus Gracilibacteria bacterium]